jgi:type I restriction enzyme S subunit
MKRGWPAMRLGDLFSFKNGRAFKKEEWTTSGLPIIRIQNLNSKDAPFNYFAGEYSRDVLVERGDLLFSWSGTVGSSFGSHLWNGATGVLNQHIFKIGLSNTIAKRYAFHGLRYITEEIEQSVSGAVGLVHITKEKLNEFTLPVPPLAEQQRIVGILDEAFEGIATAKANAEKNLQNARALFESHLQSVFTQRGEGWVEKRIPEVCMNFGRGKSRHRPRNEPSLYGGDYPFIQTGDLSNADHVVTTYTQTYSAKGLAQSKLWPKGTVGIAIVGATIGETGVLGFDACFPDSVIGMTVDPTEADPFFIEYMLQHFKDVVKSHGEGSARENINLATFDRLLFPLPTVSEQRSIVEKVDTLKNETQRLTTIYERKLAALDELKKSLLHQAFNGQL